MSNALVLASVTAVMKNLFENGLVHHGVTESVGGDVVISALTLDRIKTGEDERPQINLFLYRVKPRGLDSASRFASGADGSLPSRRAFATTSLELDYLISAYGTQDLHSEILLGYVTALLHDKPLLQGDAVRETLRALSSREGGKIVSPAVAALRECEVAERIREIKLNPVFLSPDEISQIWSVSHANYRPSLSYKATITFENSPAAAESGETSATNGAIGANESNGTPKPKARQGAAR